MDRTCAACGKTFPARSARAKFCGSSCRGKAHRGQSTAPRPEAQDPITALTTAVIRELTAARALETTLGQAAIALARLVDDADPTRSSATAAVVKELRTTMDAALKSSAPAGNLIDELRAQREKRRTSA